MKNSAEEIGKLKQHYTRMTIVICVLILVAVLLGGLFFSYAKVSAINDEYFDSLSDLHETFGRKFQNDYSSYTEEICNACINWRYFTMLREEDVGYSGSFEWEDLVTKEIRTIKSQDFVRVYYLLSDELRETEQNRILLIDESFGYGKAPMMLDFSVNAKCDAVFLYDGFITYKLRFGEETNTYFFGKPKQLTTVLEYEDTDWTSSKELYGDYYSMANSASQARLNEEASEMYTKVMEQYENGKGLKLSKKGFWTSFCIFSARTSGRTPAMSSWDTFVFHPMRIVFFRYIHVYLLALVVLLFIQGSVIFVMRKMYVNRRNFEARSRKLARSVAHELKTPLAVTKAYVENWEYIDENDRPEVAEKINSEVDHMTKMVNNLLKLSKMDAGDVQINAEEVELLSLTKSVYKRMEPLVLERELEVSWKTDEENGEYCVSADLEMIRMVIGNFLSNALKFAKKNVVISFEKNGKNVRFSIRNDGATIDPKDSKKIWDLFYKTDNARTERLSSSGVGLAANKSILELHKAGYGVKCGKEETEFWFEMKKVKK